jgi:hypothetical protein
MYRFVNTHVVETALRSSLPISCAYRWNSKVSGRLVEIEGVDIDMMIQCGRASQGYIENLKVSAAEFAAGADSPTMMEDVYRAEEL